MYKHKQAPKIILSHLHRKQRHYKRWGMISVIVALTVLVSLTAWQIIDNRRIAGSLERQAEQTVEEIKRLVIVPQDETPAVVTVIDKDKINNIPFLEKSAKNGDRLVIYSKEKKVILYRPSEKKIVDIGPVSIAPPPKESEK